MGDSHPVAHGTRLRQGKRLPREPMRANADGIQPSQTVKD
jgi:hypothetical protein